MLRFLTAGESHGKALVGILEGIPKGISLEARDFSGLMTRRWAGYGRGKRKSLEKDQVEILSGVRYGKTLGTPIAMLIRNNDHENWLSIMASEEAESPAPPITLPRAGHADLSGAQKYHCNDLRDIIERASARETAMRVALSVPAQKLLEAIGISSVAFVSRIGSVAARKPGNLSVKTMRQELAKAEPGFSTLDSTASRKWKTLIDAAQSQGDTLGGVAEVYFEGIPPGIGSHVHWDRRLDGRLGGALMSIPAVKAVEIGEGLVASRGRGSKMRDEIHFSAETGFSRKRNVGGGIEGGMTNGECLILRVYMKPIPTIKSGMTIEIGTHAAKPSRYERSDTVAVEPLAIVAQAVASLIIADGILEKFGSDTVDEIVHALQFYKSRIKNL